MSQKRWYDFESQLSKIVRSMELMNDNSQIKFGERLLDLSEQLICERGGANYMESLSLDIKEGLEKANAKNRWYDKHEKLHLAFKNLYSLNNGDRRQIAVLMMTPIKIVKAYETYCKVNGQKPDLNIIDEIMRTCLTSGSQRAENLYQIYLVDSSYFQQMNDNKPLRNNNIKKSDTLWSDLLMTVQRAMAIA